MRLAVEDSLGVIRLVKTATGKEIVRLEAPEQTRLLPRGFTPVRQLDRSWSC
jgi:hypothetical protein